MVRAALVVQRAGRLWLAIRVMRRRKDAARAISREAERALEELLESYRQRAPLGTLASWFRGGLPPELSRLPPEPLEWPPHKEQLLGLPPEAHVRDGSWWRSGLPPEGRRRAPRMIPASWFLAGLPPELTRLPPELFFVI